MFCIETVTNRIVNFNESQEPMARKSLWRNRRSILSFNQFEDLKGINRIEKERYADQKNANQAHVKF